MTRRLILMRHAKSSWGTPGIEDHARPLNGRGQRSAQAIGTWLAEQGIAPDEVLSSDSARTRETWDRVARAWPQHPQPAWQRALYHASPDTMLSALRQATGQTVLLIGHNPGCAIFAEQIARAPPEHPRFHDYPTTATLVVKVPTASWSDLRWGIADVEQFCVPRDLGVS